MPHTRTPSRPGMVAVGGPTAPKDVEAAFDGHMRDAGVSFDAAGLALNLTGEALRTMLDPGDRHVLAASRVVPLMRRLGTVEPYNAYLRLPECRVAGVMHQLLPVVARPSSGDVMLDAATGIRELGGVVENAAIAMTDGRIDPIEAAALAKVARPFLERMTGLVAHLEAIARRDA